MHEKPSMSDNENNINNNGTVVSNNNNVVRNGQRLLSAQGMAILQQFLREHGNDCIRQFVQVKQFPRFELWLSE